MGFCRFMEPVGYFLNTGILPLLILYWILFYYYARDISIIFVRCVMYTPAV